MGASSSVGRGVGTTVGRRLVGRSRELRAIEACWSDALADGGRLVMVEGESGVGKSTLASTVIERCRARGHAVWVASGEQGEQHLDLGVAAQLLDTTSASVLPDGRGGLRPDPMRVGTVLLRRVREATADGPLLVVVDDAQWCDAASLRSIGYAVRRLGDSPVLWVFLHRPTTDLRTLGRICRDGAGERIVLGPLTATQVAAVVSDALGIRMSPAAARRLHACTGGSPLEALAFAEQVGAPALAIGVGDLAVPPSFGAMIHDRLAAAPAEVEDLVAACAVHGRPVDAATLASTAEHPGAFDALDDAVSSKFLSVQRRVGVTSIDVAHPLIRPCVLSGLPPGRRARLHRRAATVTSEPVESMLHRLRGRLLPDAELSAAAIDLAQERIADGWDMEGTELLLAAAPLVEDPAARAVALLTAASRLLCAGSRNAAEHLLAASPGDAAPGHRALVEGHIALLDGDLDRAVGRLERANGEPAVAATAAGLLALAHLNAGATGPAAEWARTALEANEGATGDVGNPLVVLATCYADTGDLAGLDAEIDRWTPTLAGVAAAADGRCARALHALWSGRTAEAAHELSTVVDLERDVPFLSRVTALYVLADAEQRLGEWDLALDHAEEAAAALAASDYRLLAPMAHCIAGVVLAARGDGTGATLHLDAARSALRAFPNPVGSVWLTVARGRVASAAGDHEACAAALSPLFDLFRGGGVPDAVMAWRADLVESLIATDRLIEAREVLKDLEGALDPQDGGVPCDVARARALVLAAEGRREEAIAVVVEATDEARRGGADPVPSARLALLAGELAGPCAAADPRLRAGLESAVDTFERLRARPFLARAEALLDPADPGRGGTDEPSVPQLTPAETLVVELVAQGMTNREVAERLVLGVKTVETHVSHALAKYGVRSRTELAVRWRDQRDGPVTP